MRRIIREEVRKLNEAKSKWSFSSTGKPEMYRFSGKTFPMVSYDNETKTIFARNDNGRKPSKTYSTKTITVEALKELVKSCITGALPNDVDMTKFIKRIK